CQKYLSSPLTF
nr:immunoglobulin light chain junction region [Macaca mulatta]